MGDIRNKITDDEIKFLLLKHREDQAAAEADLAAAIEKATKVIDNAKKRQSELLAMLGGESVEHIFLASGIDYGWPLESPPEWLNISAHHEDSVTGYNIKWSWALKIQYILMERGMPMSQAEILDHIKQLDGITGDGPYKSISSVLSTKVSSKEMFGGYKPKVSGKMYYGLIGWFDKNGNIKPIYNPEL